MALSVADCDAMTRAAAAAGRQLCVGHNWLYSPAMLEAQALIAKGHLGGIVQASASFNYDVRRNPSFGQHHWSKDLPGGLAEDLAVHQLALLIRLLGAPQRTYAISRGAAAVPGGKSADVRAVVEAERGLGALAVSLRALPDMALLDIWCERAMLRLNISSMTLTIYRDLPVKRSIARGLSNFDVAAQLVGSTVGSVWKLLRKKVDGSYGIVPMIHAFYAALEAGQAGAGRTGGGYAGGERAALDLACSAGSGASRDGFMKALVTGATGFVGSYLTRALLRRGHARAHPGADRDRAAALQAAGADVRLGDRR